MFSTGTSCHISYVSNLVILFISQGPKGPRGIKGAPGDRGQMGERVSVGDKEGERGRDRCEPSIMFLEVCVHVCVYADGSVSVSLSS